MRVTGWTVPELRAAPARVVRAHIARLFVEKTWSPALAEAARAPVAPVRSFATLGQYAEARRAKQAAAEALAMIEAALWPEGD